MQEKIGPNMASVSTYYGCIGTVSLIYTEELTIENIHQSHDGLGLGAFNRLVEETQDWLGGGAEEDDDVPSTMWSEDCDDEGMVSLENRRKAAAIADAAIAADAEKATAETAAEVKGVAYASKEVLDEKEKERREARNEDKKEEREERARVEDLAFFVSQMKAYASRLRGEVSVCKTSLHACMLRACMVHVCVCKYACLRVCVVCMYGGVYVRMVDAHSIKPLSS